MPKWDEKIIKYSHGKKSLKAPFTIYLFIFTNFHLIKQKINSIITEI